MERLWCRLYEADLNYVCVLATLFMIGFADYRALGQRTDIKKVRAGVGYTSSTLHKVSLVSTIFVQLSL